MVFENIENLKSHLVYKVSIWNDSYKKAIKNEDDVLNKQYGQLVEVNENRVYKYIISNVDNYEKLFTKDSRIISFAKGIVDFVTSDRYDEYKKKYRKKYYQENIKRGDEMKFGEWNDKIAEIKVEKSKDRVSEIIDNFISNGWIPTPIDCSLASLGSDHLDKKHKDYKPRFSESTFKRRLSDLRKDGEIPSLQGMKDSGLVYRHKALKKDKNK